MGFCLSWLQTTVRHNNQANSANVRLSNAELIGLALHVETNKRNHWPEYHPGDLPRTEVRVAANSDCVGEQRCQQNHYAEYD